MIDWTPQLEDEIARRLINSSLRKLCASDAGKEFPSRASINERLATNDAFWTKCARARRVHAISRLESVESIVDECDETNARSTQVKVGYAQWFAERVLAKEFGSRVQAEVSGPNGGPIQAAVTVQFVKTGDSV